MSTPGPIALRTVARLIAAGCTVRANIIDRSGLNPQTVHRTCNALVAREWAVNIEPQGRNRPACYRLIVPLEEIEAELGETRERRAMDVGPLAQAWPLPIEVRA